MIWLLWLALGAALQKPYRGKAEYMNSGAVSRPFIESRETGRADEQGRGHPLLGG